MKRIISLLLALLTLLGCSTALAATTVGNGFHDGLAWFKDDSNQYGYIDTTGAMVITPRFNQAFDFSNGLGLVNVSKGYAAYHLINPDGSTAVKNIDTKKALYMSCDWYGDFGISEVWKPTYKGSRLTSIEPIGYAFMSPKAKIIGKTYHYIRPFTEDGFAVVGEGKLKNGTRYTRNTIEGTQVLSTYSGNTIKFVADTYYFIDMKGKQLGKTKYKQAPKDFSEGLAAVPTSVNAKGNASWDYIDVKGKVVIKGGFAEAGPFKEGLAFVKSGAKYGYIDKTGAFVVPAQYDAAYTFSSGMALVKKDGKYGFINLQGQEVIPCQYLFASGFKGAYATVQDDAKLWGVIDLDGNVVIPCQFTSILIAEDYFICNGEGNLKTVLDADGKTITSGWNDVAAYKTSNGPVFRVKKGDLYGYVNVQGDVIVQPEYTKASHFDSDAAIVWKNSNWFIVNSLGEIVF